MKYLLTFFCCLFCFASVAQFSIGARTGVTDWFSIDKGARIGDYYFSRPPEIRWDKELFARYAVKRFSFEVSVNHTKQTGSYFQLLGDDLYYPMPMRYVSARTTTTDNFFLFNTIVQFHTNSWGKNKKFKSHIGLSLSPQYDHGKETTVLERYDGTFEEATVQKYRHLDVWPGIDQTLTYDVNSHLQLSSHLFFRYYPQVSYPWYIVNSQLGLHIGAAYKISP